MCVYICIDKYILPFWNSVPKDHPCYGFEEPNSIMVGLSLGCFDIVMLVQVFAPIIIL